MRRSLLPLAIATVVLAFAAARPSAQTAPLRLIPYASGFTLPVGFIQDPLDPTVQYVVQQGGRIRTVVGGQVQAADFLDLSAATVAGGEQGLLGMAFQPTNPQRVFVDFTDPAGNTVVARFTRRVGSPRQADPATRFDLRWSTGLRYIEQPFANHNGGCLMFGPDNDLYIGMGDGGSGGDPGNRAQNPAILLGKMLRIDVSVPDADPAGFRIPPDNPFVSSPLPGVRPEIWAFGVRNPWRFSFDSPALGGTGALVIGDVGQNVTEEIDYEPRGQGGRNYGWRVREGTGVYDASQPAAFLPLTDPIYQYDHSAGNSITGGYVYRGHSASRMGGRYVFADFVRGRIWSMALTINPVSGEASASDVVEHTAELQFAGNVSSFGVDSTGELYVVNYATGAIARLSAIPSTPTNLHIIK